MTFLPLLGSHFNGLSKASQWCPERSGSLVGNKWTEVLLFSALSGIRARGCRSLWAGLINAASSSVCHDTKEVGVVDQLHPWPQFFTSPCILALCPITLRASHSGFGFSYVTFWVCGMLANETRQGLRKCWHFLPEEHAWDNLLKPESPVEQSPRQARLDRLMASPAQTCKHAWPSPELPVDLQLCEPHKCSYCTVGSFVTLHRWSDNWYCLEALNADTRNPAHLVFPEPTVLGHKEGASDWQVSQVFQECPASGWAVGIHQHFLGIGRRWSEGSAWCLGRDWLERAASPLWEYSWWSPQLRLPLICSSFWLPLGKILGGFFLSLINPMVLRHSQITGHSQRGSLCRLWDLKWIPESSFAKNLQGTRFTQRKSQSPYSAHEAQTTWSLAPLTLHPAVLLLTLPQPHWPPWRSSGLLSNVLPFILCLAVPYAWNILPWNLHG